MRAPHGTAVRFHKSLRKLPDHYISCWKQDLRWPRNPSSLAGIAYAQLSVPAAIWFSCPGPSGQGIPWHDGAAPTVPFLQAAHSHSCLWAVLFSEPLFLLATQEGIRTRKAYMSSLESSEFPRKDQKTPLARRVASPFSLHEAVESALLDRHISLAREAKCPVLDALIKRLTAGGSLSLGKGTQASGQRGCQNTG